MKRFNSIFDKSEQNHKQIEFYLVKITIPGTHPLEHRRNLTGTPWNPLKIKINQGLL